MPIVKLEQVNENQIFAIWKITESREELLDHLTLASPEKEEIDTIHNVQKLMECLAGKAAVQFLIQKEGKSYEGLFKDNCSKRFLINNDWHISISHSFPFAVAALNKKMPVGIDIEKPKDKILRIRNKFLNPKEDYWVGDDLTKATIYWSAKEALYKLHGRKKLVFKDNIRISLIKISPEPEIQGEIFINDKTSKYELFIYHFENHLLVCTGNEII